MQGTNNILSINAGSSSIKFAVFPYALEPTALMSGMVEKIGTERTALIYNKSNSERIVEDFSPGGIDAATNALLDFIRTETIDYPISFVGHRIVYGIGKSTHEEITDSVLASLEQYTDLDPEHLPLQLSLVRTIRSLFPSVQQYACYDTVFHHSISPELAVLAYPKKYLSSTMRKYGFHGLSYEYVIRYLKDTYDARTLNRVIIAHLGSGASVTALRAGVSVDTSMSFTPASGIVMSTRLGDTDPGALLSIMQTHHLSTTEALRMVQHESGLLAISETTGAMKELLEHEASDERAALAIAHFVAQAKKQIGAHAATLGGVDAIVFTGGIGERSAVLRARILLGMEHLGVQLDNEKNASRQGDIATDASATRIFVVHTDEEAQIARIVHTLAN